MADRFAAGLAPGVRGELAVRRATARIVDERGNHKGQGLVLALRNETVVLTCHHVVAGISPQSIEIALPDAEGRLQQTVCARLDPTRSRPEQDAVVLRIAIDDPPVRPLLHALSPLVYGGTLPKRASGYTHMATQSFDARVATATRLDLAAEDGAAHDAPQRYVIPHAFRLADPTDARPGVSGAVVAYEGGVLGLAHFARAAGVGQQRELYLVPLSTWADGWEELELLIEPLVDQSLRNAAVVRRVRDVSVGIGDLRSPQDSDVIIAGYRDATYVELPQARVSQLALDRGGLVIIGRPKSGKTRLAWELIRLLPDAVLIMPRDTRPPADFEVAGLSGRVIILFCDDLHAVAGSMQPLRWLERLRSVGTAAYLVATSRDAIEWKRVRENQQALLETMDPRGCIFVSQVGDQGDDLPWESGAELARRLGLTETEFQARFDGTPGSLTLDLRAMRARYERLRDEPTGGASATHLLDSLKLLHTAGQPQLNEQLSRAVAERIIGSATIGDDVWAHMCHRTIEEGFVALAAGEFRTYRPYLEECVQFSPSTEQLDGLLELLRERADWAGVIALGVTWAEQGQPTRARDALLAATASEEPDVVMVATLHYGGLLAGQHRYELASRAYRLVIDHGGPDYAPRAAYLMADMLEARGDLPGACAAYQEAINSGHQTVAPPAAIKLGTLLEAKDPQGARKAYETAIRSGDPWAPHAALKLGTLLARSGDVAEAAAAYKSAIQSGHADYAPFGALKLGELLQEIGELAGSRAAYQTAIDSRHRLVAAEAGYKLGRLLEQEGDLAGARAAYLIAVGSGHRDASEAALRLGVLLEQDGDVEGARGAYEAAVESGGYLAAPHAASNLGDLLGQLGDVEGARAAYQYAIDARNDLFAPTAAMGLGLLLQQHDDIAGARVAFQTLIDSKDPKNVGRGAVALGELLNEHGDVGGARAAYEQAINSRHPDHAPLAAVNLGMLLKSQSDIGGARAAFEQAVNSMHRDFAPLGAVLLGELLGENGDVDGARAAYEQAIDSRHPDHAPLAAVGHATLLASEGDVAAARVAYEEIIRGGHAVAAPFAMFNLAELIEEQGDVAGARAAYEEALDSGHPYVSVEAQKRLEKLDRPY